jgi:hypothetical protein
MNPFEGERSQPKDSRPGRRQVVCPCCGDFAHEPDDEGRWHATNELACGCNGRVTIGGLNTPRVRLAKEGCDCEG